MNEEQIKHLARLAEIHLSDEELSKMKKEFDVILEFV
jgi:aspartyl/glutamyl-tRNA(Asn/Gln) amidotransferase C subunit